MSSNSSLAQEGASPPDDVDPRVLRSRARIIEAATALIAESGARAVTVDAVAERSGVAKSTLYRHWPSIEALLVDVLRCAIPQSAPIDPAHTFEERLRQQVRTMAVTLADPEWIRILPDLLALRQQYPEIDDLTAADRADKEAQLAAILQLGATEGRIPSGLDPRTVATMLFGPMIVSAIFGEAEQLDSIGAYTLDRFLASYR